MTTESAYPSDDPRRLLSGDIYSLWAYLPLMIHGTVLLLGGIGFALAQRPWRRPA